MLERRCSLLHSYLIRYTSFSPQKLETRKESPSSQSRVSRQHISSFQHLNFPSKLPSKLLSLHNTETMTRFYCSLLFFLLLMFLLRYVLFYLYPANANLVNLKNVRNIKNDKHGVQYIKLFFKQVFAFLLHNHLEQLRLSLICFQSFCYFSALGKIKQKVNHLQNYYSNQLLHSSDLNTVTLDFTSETHRNKKNKRKTFWKQTSSKQS